MILHNPWTVFFSPRISWFCRLPVRKSLGYVFSTVLRKKKRKPIDWYVGLTHHTTKNTSMDCHRTSFSSGGIWRVSILRHSRGCSPLDHSPGHMTIIFCVTTIVFLTHPRSPTESTQTRKGVSSPKSRVPHLWRFHDFFEI